MYQMFSNEELENLRSRLISYRDADDLPSEEDLIALADRTVSSLEAEDKKYRPYSAEKKPGGLLDFSKEEIPVILVPDIHARPEFLISLLASDVLQKLGIYTEKEFDGDVLDALNKDLVMLVCVGDVWHTENTSWAYNRWRTSYEKWMNGDSVSPEMCDEMKENFAAVMGVMELKNAFPRNFHFLKGNHENIMNSEGHGDHGFLKFAMEGEMVRDFVYEKYGDVTLHMLSCFEKALPIVAVFLDFCVSHAEPLKAYKRNDIINYHDHGDLILGFTWTANDEAQKDSVEKQFKELNPKGGKKEALWFGGHRPVPEKFLLRQDGHFVQFHNPEEMNVALLSPGREFKCERDIVSII